MNVSRLIIIMLPALLSGCVSTYKTLLSEEPWPRGEESRNFPISGGKQETCSRHQGEIFGGVQTDLAIAEECSRGGWGLFACVLLPPFIIDLPFSLVGDIVYAPFILASNSLGDYRNYDGDLCIESGDRWRKSGKSELSGAWKERFQDVGKLKAYTEQGIKVDVSDAAIGNFDLTGAVFDGAVFRDNAWHGTTGAKMAFSNATFRSNTFENVDFKDSVFSNVTFEDSEFYATAFSQSRLNGVKFVRCKFHTSAFKGTYQHPDDSAVVFDNSTLERVDFFGSHANFSFDHSTLTKLHLQQFIIPSSLAFDDSRVETPISAGSDGPTIKALKLSNCKNRTILDLYKAQIDTLQISNCPAIVVDANNANIQSFSIAHSSIGASKFKRMKVVNFTLADQSSVDYVDFEEMNAVNFTIYGQSAIKDSSFNKMKVENFALTDVQFGGKLNFAGAQVDHVATKNISKWQGLRLDLAGSNFTFPDIPDISVYRDQNAKPPR